MLAKAHVTVGMEKGICLGWFYADRFANKVFATAGSTWLVAAVILSLRR